MFISSSYTQKADIAETIAHLLPHVKDRTTKLQVITLISKLWLDADHHVRSVGIKSIRELGELGVPEVKECFSGKETAPVGLMELASGLMGDVHYGEKGMLMDLLRWKFSIAK
jgi:hypothetical protein